MRSGRTSFGIDAWENDGFAAFAARHGFESKSTAIQRRQVLADIDHDELVRRHEEALRLSVGLRDRATRSGLTPEDELDGVAEMSAAINDAPTDDLDIEDEVYSAERIRGYEQAQLARGRRLYRVFARHRGPARSPATRSSWSSPTGRPSASSTTPRSSAATEDTASGSCSRPT